MQEDKNPKSKQQAEEIAKMLEDQAFFLQSQMNQVNSVMSRLAETIKHTARKTSSNKFDENLLQLLMHPHDPESIKFLDLFIDMLKAPTYEAGDCLGEIALVKPKTFALNLELISQASRLIPILQELDHSQKLDLLLENMLGHFLPDMENKIATVIARKQPHQKKGIQFELFRLNTHKIRAIFCSGEAPRLIKKNSIEAAEESLNTTFKFRTQTQSSPATNQAEFAELLKSRSKTLRKDLISNRSSWNEGARIIEEMNNSLLDNAGDCIHYLLCGELAALQKSPNFSLIECYCDLSEAALIKIKLNDKSINETIPFTGTAALLHKIADAHLQAGRMNSALRCYQKALNLYNQAKDNYVASKSQILAAKFTQEYYNEQYKKLLSPIIKISQSIEKIQQKAFEQFQSDWKELKVPNEIQSIDFEKSGYAMKIVFTDRALLLAWLKQLGQLHLPTDILTSPQQKLSVTLPSVHQLSAQRLFNSLERAQKAREAEKIRAQKLLNAAAIREKQKAQELVTAQEPVSDNQSHGYVSSPDKDLYPEPKTRQVKKSAQTIQTTAATKPATVLKSQSVSWKENLPDYVSEDEVYPIPDPFIANSSIPKGIFYGYIDDEIVNINAEIHGDLLKKFHEVLSTGMIAGLGDAQGIRPVQSELGHESDYLFKLNIGREDFRLYGRKVAEQKLPNGQMVVLISFDQAITHDKKLKLEPNDNNSKNTL